MVLAAGVVKVFAAGGERELIDVGVHAGGINGGSGHSRLFAVGLGRGGLEDLNRCALGDGEAGQDALRQLGAPGFIAFAGGEIVRLRSGGQEALGCLGLARGERPIIAARREHVRVGDIAGEREGIAGRHDVAACVLHLGGEVIARPAAAVGRVDVGEIVFVVLNLIVTDVDGALAERTGRALGSVRDGPVVIAGAGDVGVDRVITGEVDQVRRRFIRAVKTVAEGEFVVGRELGGGEGDLPHPSAGHVHVERGAVDGGGGLALDRVGHGNAVPAVAEEAHDALLVGGIDLIGGCRCRHAFGQKVVGLDVGKALGRGGLAELPLIGERALGRGRGDGLLTAVTV